MFSQVSVCPLGVSATRTTTPTGQTPPWAETPPRHTLSQADTPWPVHAGIHPPAQCMLGYGQQAGGMHPTGMHSCCY